jgi:outer membrane murein-binding lipoprotein Lpp
VGKYRPLSLAAGAALMLSACVTFVAPYDEKIDDMATSLQRGISTEIESLSGADRPDCLYPNHAAFYRAARVDVSALEVRAQAHDLNSQTIRQIEDLNGALNDMEALHKIATQANRCMKPSEFSDIRRAFDQITGAIIRLEIAKKRAKP